MTPTPPAFVTGTHLAIEVAPKEQLFDINIGAPPVITASNLPIFLIILVILIDIAQITATFYIFKILDKKKKYAKY